MSQKSTFYGFIAAATATTAFGVVYTIARSRLVAFRNVGEGTAQEIRGIVSAVDLSLLLLIVTGVLTVILFSRFITQKRRDTKSLSA